MEVDRMSALPEDIIQHIQYFLDIGEGTQTMVLCKSWHRAWCTRPSLNFNLKHIWRRKVFDNTLVNLVNSTLKRYLEQEIPILKLRLYVMEIDARWIKVVRINNVIELDLGCLFRWKSSLWEEILQIKSLQVLKVSSMVSKLVLSDADIKCCNLKKLELNFLHIDGVTFQHIMCCCPLIEELDLLMCRFFNFHPANPSIQSFMFEGASLRKLSLIDNDINDELLQTILSKNPHLVDLTLVCYENSVRRIKLSSLYLKRVGFGSPRRKMEVIIDAPNLDRMKFCSFRTTPFPVISPITKGMVDVSIVYCDSEIDASWFHGLREFLTKFAKSNINLALDRHPLRFNFKVLRANPLPHWHEVEALMIKEWFKCLPLLSAFFGACHPKTVLLGHLNSVSELASLKKLCKALSYQGNLGCCKLDQNKCWRHYIKNAKLYHVVDHEQQPLDMNELKTGLGTVISLALEWGSSD